MYEYKTDGPIVLRTTLEQANLIVTTTTDSTATVNIVAEEGKNLPTYDVSFENGVLTIDEVKSEKVKSGFFSRFGANVYFNTGSKADATIRVALPESSRMECKNAMGRLDAQGNYAAISMKSGMGSVDIDDCDALTLEGGAGKVHVGTLRDGTIKSGAGKISIGECGDVMIKSGTGSIDIATLRGAGDIKVGAGRINIGCAVEGSLEIKSGTGAVSVGVPHGTACLLDVETKVGAVKNSLDHTDGPAENDKKLELTIRAAAGSISLTRA